jgi:hypothetical protein
VFPHGTSGVGIGMTMNMIEFFDDASNLEGRQIPQSTASNPGIAAADAQGAFFETSSISNVLGPTLLNMRPLGSIFGLTIRHDYGHMTMRQFEAWRIRIWNVLFQNLNLSHDRWNIFVSLKRAEKR